MIILSSFFKKTLDEQAPTWYDIYVRWRGRLKKRKGKIMTTTKETQGKVTLYKITITEAPMMDETRRSDYSLVPWTGDNIDYAGYDDGGRAYELPDGFRVDATRYGQAIYDKDGKHAELGAIKGNPVLFQGNGKMTWLMAK
jgi:hypothetical protein